MTPYGASLYEEISAISLKLSAVRAAVASIKSGHRGKFPVDESRLDSDSSGVFHTMPACEPTMTNTTLSPRRKRSMSSDLARLLCPRSVAVIGATDRPGSVGAGVVHNLLGGKFAGNISFVNPNRAEILGKATHPTVHDVPQTIDLAVVCTPAPSVASIVRQCGEAGVGGVVVLSAGFRESGPLGAQFEYAVSEELSRFPRMRLIGPNCVGLHIPGLGLNASFTRGTTSSGGVALCSQSGALCSSMLEWARDAEIGLSHCVSVGNTLDVDFGDLLEYFAEHASTTSVVLYIEAITDGQRFLAAARRCTARKPVIVYKAGRYADASKAAMSHTGALAGDDDVYQAAFDEAGIIRVERLDELAGAAELLGRTRQPRGARLAIVTNAGGPGVIAADALAVGRGKLAALRTETLDELNKVLPSNWSHANPVDVIGDSGHQRLATALECVLEDDAVDAALVMVTPQQMIDTRLAAGAIVATASRHQKPVLAVWMTGRTDEEARTTLRNGGIPVYPTPEQAVGAFLPIARYAEWSERPRDVWKAVPFNPTTGVAARRIVTNQHGLFNEHASKKLFALYGIPVSRTIFATDVNQAAAAARSVGYPVAMKVVSPGVTHKTEVGGVRLDLHDEKEVREAFEQIGLALKQSRPDARFAGVTVQSMIDRSGGVEVIVGVRRDPTFGPVALVGAGGTVTEVLRDRAIAVAPVSNEQAVRLIHSLRIAPMLGSFRGRPPLNTRALAEMVVSMSRMISEIDELEEAEANPVLVTVEGVIALDARVLSSSGVPE